MNASRLSQGEVALGLPWARPREKEGWARGFSVSSWVEGFPQTHPAWELEKADGGPAVWEPSSWSQAQRSRQPTALTSHSLGQHTGQGDRHFPRVTRLSPRAGPQQDQPLQAVVLERYCPECTHSCFSVCRTTILSSRVNILKTAPWMNGIPCALCPHTCHCIPAVWESRARTL